MSLSQPTRLVEFEGCFNFRDLGGYEATDGRRVRWNMLYRSDTLHRLTAADVEVFGSLGLRTVIDLRSQTEVDDHGRAPSGDGSLAWHHAPMLDNVRLAPRADAERSAAPAQPLRPGEGYLAILEQFGAAVAAVVAILSEEGAFPAVFHCTAGKDRTGIVAALILDVLGVEDASIAADYAMTEETRARSSAWIEANEPDYAAFLAQIPAEYRVARPETILGFLEGIRERFGSVAGLLARLGVSEGHLDTLRERLLED